MAALGQQAAILAVSRLLGYGLVLLSPIILVRLLSVENFGRYREFVLYASLLVAVAGFNISDSLMRFVPAHPDSKWRIVRQTAALTAVASGLVVAVVVLLDLALRGALVGAHLLPLAVYGLLFCNIDFWEMYWLANHNTTAVFAYSLGRLMARMAVVLISARLTGDVETIIWSLVWFESLRLALAALLWRSLDQSAREPPLEYPWRDQIRFCLPSGAAVLLSMVMRNLNNLAVTRALGVGALAQYTIALYSESIVVAIRNSVSTVVLGEMVTRSVESRTEALGLWQRATVINLIILLPVAVLLARYAEPLIVTVFGATYRTAAPVMMVYSIAIVCQCFDFAPALRAFNRPTPLMHSSVIALLANLLALWYLIPAAGMVGAVLAYILALLCDGCYLAWHAARVFEVPIRDLIPWRRPAKVVLCAAVAFALIWSNIWVISLGFAGIVLGSIIYVIAYALLLRVIGLPEALTLQSLVTRALGAALSSVRS